MPINLPVRLLPVAEHWDCHGCGICCRHAIIPLSNEEYQRIRGQGWDKDAELAGRRLFVRMFLWKAQYRLAHRPDGFCVFLSPEGRCRIHEKFGPEAKPLICRMFPYQLVPLNRFAYLTLRHNCPSVISRQGRSLGEQEDSWRPLVETDRFRVHSAPPPPLTAAYRGSWNQFLHVANCIERLLTDERYPMVRRLAHTVAFAQLLDRCRLAQLDAERFGDLIGLLEGGVTKEVAQFFDERFPPHRTSQLVFRRCLIEYYRLHPGYRLETSWRGRLNWILTSWSMAIGRGKIPALAEPSESLHIAPSLQSAGSFSPADMGPDWNQSGQSETIAETAGPPPDSHSKGSASRSSSPSQLVICDSPDWVDLTVLDKNLGALHRDILQPFDDYYETMAISKRYAVCGRRGWPLTDRIRALAMSFAAGLALLRLACPQGRPTRDDVAAIVIALDRGETYQTLASPIYRRRLRVLDRAGELIRLLLWYAR